MFYSLQVKGAFRPISDWVILQPVEEVKQKGGILLPDQNTEYGRCLVVAVGPGHRPYDGLNHVYKPKIVRTELKPGQHVYIQKFVEGEFKFELNGKKVYAIRERHLNLTIDVEPAKKISRKAA